MRRALLSSALVAVALGGAAFGCGKPVGSEGGPCTEGGACDDGLACVDALCVVDEGACKGDEPATSDLGDCANIATAACAAVEDNEAVVTCEAAALTLRSGLFQAAFDCISEIPVTRCGNLGPSLDDCFAALNACPLEAATSLCAQADDTCAAEGDDGFPLDACEDDLTPMNLDFRETYADCFNQSAGLACSSVHDDCYNTATNALLGGE